MTFYTNEVARLTKKIYPHDDLTRKIIQSKAFIDKNFESGLSIDLMASQVFISRFHFIRLFKKYYGRTPNQYLQEKRIEAAKALLKKGKSIDFACNKVGFTSKTTFTTLFKKITGMTPLVYKNKKAILKNK